MAKDFSSEQAKNAAIVGSVLVNRLCNEHPELICALLQKHQEQPSDDPNINYLKTVALSQERGRFFDEDFDKAAEGAGYYGTQYALNATGGFFSNMLDKAVVLAGGAAAGSAGLPPGIGAAVAAKTNEKRHQFFDKLKDKLKNVFSKGKKADGTEDPNTPPKTPMEIGDHPDTKKIIDGDLDKDDDKKKPKKKMFLGLAVGWWIGIGVGLFLLIVTIIMVRIHNKKTGKKAA